MLNSTAEIMNRGMRCLLEGLGVVEAEQFISVVIREKFDYTKWQKDFFDKIPEDLLMSEAIAFDKAHPFQGDPSKII